MLFDAHNHLHDKRLRPHLDVVLERAAEAGIGRMVLNGTSPDDWADVRRMVEDRPEALIASFGLHPWWVRSGDEGWKRGLERMLDALPSAVGEIGLDRWKEPRDEDAQERAFAWQMDLARERNLPVAVHCLRAWGWLKEVLQRHPAPKRGWMLHSYGGSPEMVEELAQSGCYFSFSANVAEEKRGKLREALQAVPADRLLIETDAPDMLPPSRLGGHVIKGDGEDEDLNAPATLAGVRDFVAEVRRVDSGEIERLTAENAARFFDGVMLS